MHRIETVIEAAESLALTDLATVKDELGIAADETSKDARLARYIDQASAQAHSYCNRIFPVQTYRNEFRLTGRHLKYGEPLILSAPPILDILAISEDGVAVDVADYEGDAAAGLVWRAFWPERRGAWCRRDTVVDFRGGYETIPADVIAAVLRIVTMAEQERGRDPFLKARDGPTWGREELWIGPVPGTVAGMPRDAAQLLQPYIRPISP